MILFDNKNQCFGCTACEAACPFGAIAMKSDDEGFKYPEIKEELCVECGKCKSVCQIHSLKKQENIQAKFYAAQNKDDNVRAKSTSGGMFSIFAEQIVNEGGTVYGVAYSDDFQVVHKRSESKKGYEQFRGSKYAQSDLSGCFTMVKEDLNRGRKVLFSGTPCQIAGLNTFLYNAKGRENLLLCEIICHGTPSPMIWKEHLAFLEKERHSKVVKYVNRSKVAGWHGHNEHVYFENGKSEYTTKLSNLYKDLFYAHLTIRPCCYSCKYTDFPRIADITIADFWGIENFHPDFDDNKGTSLLTINTEQGMLYYDKLKENISCIESNWDEAFYDNHKRPAKMNVNREEFWKDYKKYGYAYVAKKYSGYSFLGRLKRKMKIIAKSVSKKVGIYSFIHKFTQKKYQKDTYK